MRVPRWTLLVPVALAGCAESPAMPRTALPGSPSVELVETTVQPGYVRLEWQVTNAPGDSLLLQRRHDDDPWKFRAWLAPDASGRMVFEDSAVTPGEPYSWRVRLAGHEPEYQGAVTLTVPQ